MTDNAGRGPRSAEQILPILDAELARIDGALSERRHLHWHRFQTLERTRQSLIELRWLCELETYPNEGCDD